MSTDDQNEQGQVEALKRSGATDTVVEKASGVAERPLLDITGRPAPVRGFTGCDGSQPLGVNDDWRPISGRTTEEPGDSSADPESRYRRRRAVWC